MVPDLDDVAVTLVTRAMPPVVGGVERQMALVAAVLAKAGAHVTVITATVAPTPIAGVTIYSRPALAQSMPLYLAWMACHAFRRRSRRSVIVSARASAETSVLALLASLFRRPVVMFLTGGTTAGSELLAQRRRWARRALAQRVTAAVAHADVFLDELRSQGFRGVTAVIPTIAEEYSGACDVGTPAAPVVWVGRDDPVKNLVALVRIVDQHLAVDGAQSPHALLIADRRPSVAPAGAMVHTECPAPRSHLRDCGVFLLTSLIEGQSNAMAEAALEGVPTVAYATGGTPELVAALDCGEALPLTTSDAQMADAVRRVATRFADPAERRALRARARRRFVDDAPTGWIRIVARMAAR